MDRSVGSPRTRSVVGVRGPGVSVFGLPIVHALETEIYFGLQRFHTNKCPGARRELRVCPREDRADVTHAISPIEQEVQLYHQLLHDEANRPNILLQSAEMTL